MKAVRKSEFFADGTAVMWIFIKAAEVSALATYRRAAQGSVAFITSDEGVTAKMFDGEEWKNAGTGIEAILKFSEGE